MAALRGGAYADLAGGMSGGGGGTKAILLLLLVCCWCCLSSSALAGLGYMNREQLQKSGWLPNL